MPMCARGGCNLGGCAQNSGNFAIKSHIEAAENATWKFDTILFSSCKFHRGENKVSKGIFENGPISRRRGKTLPRGQTEGLKSSRLGKSFPPCGRFYKGVARSWRSKCQNTQRYFLIFLHFPLHFFGNALMRRCSLDSPLIRPQFSPKK